MKRFKGAESRISKKKKKSNQIQWEPIQMEFSGNKNNCNEYIEIFGKGDRVRVVDSWPMFLGYSSRLVSGDGDSMFQWNPRSGFRSDFRNGADGPEWARRPSADSVWAPWLSVAGIHARGCLRTERYSRKWVLPWRKRWAERNYSSPPDDVFRPRMFSSGGWNWNKI